MLLKLEGLIILKKKINEFYNSAIEDLKNFDDNEFKESLKKLIKYVIERNY